MHYRNCAANTAKDSQPGLTEKWIVQILGGLLWTGPSHSLASLWRRDVAGAMKRCIVYQRYRSASWLLSPWLLLKRSGLNSQFRQIFSVRIPISYVLRSFEICQGALEEEFQVCCGFYGSDLIRYLLGRVETVTEPQRRRIRPPRCPSCSHSGHLSWDTQELDTSA